MASEAAVACPKCGAPEVIDACRQCGLQRSRHANYLANRPATSPELLAAWATCQQAWDDPKAHQRILELAAGQHAYPWLAAQYSQVLRQRPTDEVAQAQVARLTRATEAALTASALARTPPDQRKKFSNVIIFLALLVFILVGGWLVLNMMRSPESGPKPGVGIPRAGH